MVGAGGDARSGQGGVAKPRLLRKVWTWEMHWIVGRVEAGACNWRSTSWNNSGVLLYSVFAASCQDAQKAAAVWWKALRRPRPPRLRASQALCALVSGKAGSCRSWAKHCWMLWSMCEAEFARQYTHWALNFFTCDSSSLTKGAAMRSQVDMAQTPWS